MPFRVVTFGNALNIGTAGSHYVEIAARAKCNSGNSPYCVPNEYICAKLGQFLGLPIAPGTVITVPANDPKFWYAALDFSQEGESLPPVSPEDCVRQLPELCAAIVLFDIFIANGDRHEGNLFLDESSEPPEMRLFDHEVALLGATPGQAEGRLTGSVRNHLGILDHCLKRLLSTEALWQSEWMQRIYHLPTYLIEQACREAAPYGMTLEETNAAIAFLGERRHNLYYLVQHHGGEFAPPRTRRQRL